MSSIIRQKVGDKIYLYESVSYRNGEGKPRNRRVPIGKIDPLTGQPSYKADYLARMMASGAFVEVAASTQTFTPDDIRRSSVLEFGAMYLLQSIAEQIGLLNALQSVLPKAHQEIFTLACYLVSSGDPFLYCEEWLSKTSCPAVGSLSSQRISDLLQTITPDQREAFYQAWCQMRSEQEYLALDITSTSSYSDLIQDVEWGYNRDKEQLPQINICMLMGETSRLPIYQVLYSGSLKDVSTLETTLSKMDAVSGGKPTLAVMDKGFFSTRNVNAMMNRAHPTRFVIAVPFTSQFAKKMVASERKDIDCLQHTLVIGERAWNEKHRLHTHVYYHAMKALKLREELYAHVTVLKEKAEADPKTALKEELSKKYLIIRKSEKGFLRLKTQLDLGRLRVHRDDSMQNKVFIGFIALILMSHLHKVMLDKDLYKTMTLKKLLLILSKLRVQHISGQRILFPLTKEQKAIYKAFAVKEPV
jgi:hypothetical protein